MSATGDITVTASRFVHVGKHGGMVSPEIQSWADRVVKAFPAAIDETFFIRRLHRAGGKGQLKARETERKQDDRNQERADTDEW
jgi:hypothetical protein